MFNKIVTVLAILVLALFSTEVRAQVGRPEILSVERFAGITSSGGSINGDRLTSRFNEPIDLVITSVGVIYVAEEGGSSIRKIDANGVVSSFVGGSGTGFLNGTGSAARFNQIRGIALDKNGNIIVADKDNHAIRKVTPEGIVTTIAGSTVGFKDGNSTEALFNKPVEVLVDNNNNIYVADALNYRVRKIDPSGNVSTLVGRGVSGYLDGNLSTATLDVPTDFDFDSKGDLIIVTYHAVRRFNLTTEELSTIVGGATATTYTDGNKATAGFGFMNGLLLDEGDIIYVVDRHGLRHVSQEGFVTTIAGSVSPGNVNGTPLSSGFHFPRGIIKSVEGDLLIADKANHVIRKILLGPSAHIKSSTETHNTASPFTVTFKFNKAVNGFTASDIVINNGTISNFSGSGSSYSADITPTGNSAITVDVPANVVLDINSNPNTAAHQLIIPLDQTNPIFTSVTTATFTENGTGTAYTAVATDANAITYSLGTGNDEALFDIVGTSGVITFKASPDFEAPADANTDNAYVLEVKASDGVNTVAQTVTITVTDVDDTDPVFTSAASASFVENSTGAAYTAVATDANTITYSLGTGNDEGLFDIAGTSGVITFKAAPDFEAPADANTDNAYVLEVKATDGINTVAQTVTITVTDIDDTDPVFTSATTTSFVENSTGTAYTAVATDANAITYSLGSSNDEGLFDIDGLTGAVTFKAAPDFEAPADANTDNAYVLEVNASDGVNTATQTVIIAVTNDPEAVLRVTGDLTVPNTALGLISTFDVTIHNDGDAELTITSISYPTGFNGSNLLAVSAGNSEVLTISFSPTEAITYAGDIIIVTNGGSETLSVSAVGEIITSIDDSELKVEAISLYPNPVKNILYVDLSEVVLPVKRLELINSSGVLSHIVKNPINKVVSINTAPFTSGIYLLRISDGQSVVTKKVIIKR